MTTEFRFDDLDLREEPARGDSEQADPASAQTNACTGSNYCTKGCCTLTC